MRFARDRRTAERRAGRARRPDRALADRPPAPVGAQPAHAQRGGGGPDRGEHGRGWLDQSDPDRRERRHPGGARATSRGAEACAGRGAGDPLRAPLRAQKRAYVLADNQIALQAGWSEELLAEELAWLRDERFDLDLIGFDATELERLLTLADGETAQDESEDEVPEPPEEPVTRPGDFWLLGNHRLLCGDATVLTDVERVLGGQQGGIHHET